MDRTDPRHCCYKPNDLARTLQTLSYHLGLVMTEPAPGTLKVSLCGPQTTVIVEITFEPSLYQDDSPLGRGVHDLTTVRVEGEDQAHSTGNRCGARNALAALYAPVVAEVAAAEAAEAQSQKEAA